MKVPSISVVVCTHNRATLLRETLAAMQAMTPPPDCTVEVVVVDNNSTDNTQAVIAEAKARRGLPIVSLQETQQGKSFALNTALLHAKGSVLALTDDDVLPEPDWLTRIAEDFRQNDFTFVFGKVLPRWSRRPPPELLLPAAQAIWGPLAIVDYGDEPTLYLPDAPGQRLPIGANVAISRDALLTIGGWRTDLGKFNNSLLSGEDHEIFMRLRRCGLYSGYYDPRVVVHHYVPAHRLTRSYFRRWFYWNGKTAARMLPDMYPELDMSRVPRIAGVPRFALRQAFQQGREWAAMRLRHNTLEALIEELRFIRYIGMFVQCWQHSRQQPTPSGPERTRCGAGLAEERVNP